jgi:DNA polymerase-1
MYDIIIIDGNNLAHRAFHVHKDLGTKIDDRYIFTGVPYGSIISILGYVQKYLNESGKVIVTWDEGRDRRKEIYPDYKGNRTEDWEDYDNFMAQRMLAKFIFRYCGILQVSKKGEEADDIIGTLSTNHAREGRKVLIVSGDHDMKQLLLENIHLLKPSTKKDILWDVKYFMKEYDGLYPHQYFNIMCLTGDSGDNIPGIRGVGEKTALKIIKDDVDVVFKLLKGENIKLTNEKHTKLLIENREVVRLASRLVLIHRNIEKMKYINPVRNIRKLRTMFLRLKFHSLLDVDKFDTILRMV